MPVTPNSIVSPQNTFWTSAVATTANTTWTDTPTNTVALTFTNTNGARVKKITALARAIPAATQLQLYASSDAGTTKRLINTVTMPASSGPAASLAQIPVDFGYTEEAPLVLGPGVSLWVGIGVTNTGIVFSCEGYLY